MTFNENADFGKSKTSRRGRNTAIAGGGVVGLGGLAVLLISMFTGQDLSGLIGILGGGEGTQSGGSGESAIVENCDTGEDANRDDACRLEGGSIAINDFWADSLKDYREPELVIVDGQTSTQCGTASNATGPFYCPPEETVYIDPTFFGLLRSQYDASAGDLAQLYVLAHEYGHHVQNLIGVFQDHPQNGTGPDSNGVRTELQADCFAGAWVAAMEESKDADGDPYLKPATPQQIKDALNAAAAVGDDHIQEQSGGQVNPESWTHGSSEQRQRWFDEGRNGGVNSCDTFSVSGSQL